MYHSFHTSSKTSSGFEPQSKVETETKTCIPRSSTVDRVPSIVPCDRFFFPSYVLIWAGSLVAPFRPRGVASSQRFPTHRQVSHFQTYIIKIIFIYSLIHYFHHSFPSIIYTSSLEPKISSPRFTVREKFDSAVFDACLHIRGHDEWHGHWGRHRKHDSLVPTRDASQGVLWGHRK